MKVKVISLPYIFQVLYVLCFTRPRYQVSVYRTIGPLVKFVVLTLQEESQKRLGPGGLDPVEVFESLPGLHQVNVLYKIQSFVPLQ